MQAADSEVIQHLSSLLVGQAINHLRIDYDLVEYDQIWNEFADVSALVHDRKTGLLYERDTTPVEFDRKGALVRLLQQAMTEGVMDLECTRDDWPRFACESSAFQDFPVHDSPLHVVGDASLS